MLRILVIVTLVGAVAAWMQRRSTPLPDEMHAAPERVSPAGRPLAKARPRDTESGRLLDLRAEIDRSLGNFRRTEALITVLGALPGETAQHAMHELMKAYEGNPAVLLAAIRTFHLGATPSVENVEYLLGRYADKTAPEDVREAALLAAGSAYGVLSSNSAAGSLEHRVRETLAQVQDPSERRWLTATLQDAAERGSLPVLRDLAWGADETLAVRATEALRFLPGEDADRALLHLLESRNDPRIRDSAAFALGQRPLGEKTLESISDIYDSSAPDADGRALRQRLLDLLGREGKRDVLSRAAESDRAG